MYPFFRRAVLLILPLCFAVLAGCADPFSSAKDDPVANLKKQEITAGSFRIVTYSRIRDTNQPITVYIEGDVRGWSPVADPGADATPDEDLGLRLAQMDPSENVVFVSHPCQFGVDDALCLDRTWKTGPLAEQVYTSIDRALDHAIAGVTHTHLNLVGYSGGGGVAVVLAARRHDVVSLRTIAGNLDPDGNARAHGAPPRDDYISPVDYAPRLSALPQEHFVGDKDTLVPPYLTENFVKAIGVSYCVKVSHIAEASHKTGWEEAWQRNRAKMPGCDAKPREQKEVPNGE